MTHIQRMDNDEICKRQRYRKLVVENSSGMRFLFSGQYIPTASILLKTMRAVPPFFWNRLRANVPQFTMCVRVVVFVLFLRIKKKHVHLPTDR